MKHALSQQQLGRGPLRPTPPDDPTPADPDDGASRPTRFVGWLGGLGCAAAGYAVFQFLFEVLPDSVDGEAAKYLVASVSGLGTALSAWLAAALLRARTTAPAPRPLPRPATGTTPPAGSQVPGPLPQLFAATYDTLVGEVSVVEDPERGRLVGWSHSLGESSPSRPTSVGTAYGLQTMLDLGTTDGRLSTGELADTLWRLRLPDGGWSARSQGARARPEVTALVLGALARAGASRGGRLAREVDLCTAAFTHDADRAGRESTHVMTTVLRGLLRAAPDCDALPVLREALVDGAVSDPHRNRLRCWGYRLDPPPPHPSPVHTAQAVLALDRAARVLGESPAVRAAREDGVRWLLSCPDAAHHDCRDLENGRDEVRRPRPDDPARHEVLNVRHFTASWVVRALLCRGSLEVARQGGLEETWRELLDGAAACVRAGQQDGIWSWAQSENTELRRPLWMTYQGVSALRAHAVWTYRPDEAAPAR
ncbi:prenyltransferase/squalene oxidase repeat-containing protein [Streptomyces incanus]